MNRNDLEYTNGFDKVNFYRYYANAAGPERFEDDFCRLLFDKVIIYAVKHNQTTRDSLAYCLFDIIPGCDFEEAAAFCSDDLLTDAAREIKEKFWAKQEAEERASKCEIVKKKTK